MKRHILYLLIIPVLFLFSCRADDSDDIIPSQESFCKVTSVELIESNINRTTFCSNVSQAQSYLMLIPINSILSSCNNGIDSVSFYRVKYELTINNTKVNLSGLLIIPNTYFIDSFSVLVANHETMSLVSDAPSLGYYNVASTSIYSSMAYGGFIVMIPDYEGFGENAQSSNYNQNTIPCFQNVHPYCVLDRCGIPTADMIISTKKYINSHKSTFGKSAKNDTYIMGYSEGGYVSIAAQKTIEENQTKYSSINLKGVAALAGNFDLSGSMLDSILSINGYYTPYVVAMIIQSYQRNYGEEFSWNNIIKVPYNTTIPPLLDGLHSGTSEISTQMPNHIRDYFTDNIISDLINKIGIWNRFADNDLCLTIDRGWIPKTPIYLCHHPKDETVPYSNSLNFKNKAIAKGCDIVLVDAVSLLSYDYHQYAAADAIPKGFKWIYDKEYN